MGIKYTSSFDVEAVIRDWQDSENENKKVPAIDRWGAAERTQNPNADNSHLLLIKEPFFGKMVCIASEWKVWCPPVRREKDSPSYVID